MRFRRHHRKLFWPLGLITLALLPLLFFHFLAENPETRPKTGMEINLPPPEFHRFARISDPGFELPPKGNWDTYLFAEDNLQNQTQLIQLQEVIRRFTLQSDTSKGILIRLARRMPYGTFVDILDMLNLENVTRYSLIDGDIFVHRFPPSKNSMTDNLAIMICGGVFIRERSVESTWNDKLKSAFSQFATYWQDVVNQLPPLVFLIWFGLCGLNVYQVYQNYRANVACRLTSRSS